MPILFLAICPSPRLALPAGACDRATFTLFVSLAV